MNKTFSLFFVVLSACAPAWPQDAPAAVLPQLQTLTNMDAKDTATRLALIQESLLKLDVQSNLQLFLQQYGDRVRIETVGYRSDGLQVIPGYLLSPRKTENGKRYPGLVMVHGGFHDHLDTYYFRPLAEAVSRGYVVLFPEYRGSSGYGEVHYQNSYGKTDVADVLSGADFLKSQPNVDPARVGIVGHSRGGMVTLLAIEKQPQCFKVAVSIAGLSDFIAYMGYKPEYRRLEVAKEETFGGKLPNENLKAYMDISPLNNVEAIETPLLVLANTFDQTVPFKLHSGRLIDLLKAHGKVFDSHVYADAPGAHMFLFADTPEARDCWVRTFDWLGEIPETMRHFSLLLSVLCLPLTAPAQLIERPLVTGRQVMVTSLEPLASMAGMRILQQGGNAFDAAVATAIAVTVLDPRMSSIGGQGFATIYVASGKQVRAINFFGPSPRASTLKAFEGKDYSRGYLSSPVPSCLRGYWELHRTYGKLSWAQLLQPAIELAEHGFIMTDRLSEEIRDTSALLARFPATAKVFLPGGNAPKAGDLFLQPDLARTLKMVAAKGADVFYQGEIADAIAAFYKQHEGLLSKEDLSAYHARWVQPISTTYRGYTFFTQPPNSSGIAVLEQLNLLEGFDLRSLGHNTPEYLHVVGEVMRLAVADRNRYVGDPDFANVPVDRLLSKEYASARRQLIDPSRTMPVATAGDTEQPTQSHTTHLNAVDADGNMVAMTQTLGAAFGSAVVVGNTGVLFSNQMRHLHLDPQDPSRMEPGKRPRSNESPLIVLKDGRPFMALGSPGNDGIWQRLVQVIVNVIDFHMDIQTAITAPRMTYGGTQETGTRIDPVFDVEDRMPPAVMQALRNKGFKVKPVQDDIGRVNGIMIDPRSGFRLGGADPREYGYALGW